MSDSAQRAPCVVVNIDRSSFCVEFVAKTIGERVYALLAFSGLGLAVAILGRAGATLKGGEDVRITVTHETANAAGQGREAYPAPACSAGDQP